MKVNYNLGASEGLTLQWFNPNKAGHFEDNFSWVGCQFDPPPPPPPSYFKKNLSNINITLYIVKQSV